MATPVPASEIKPCLEDREIANQDVFLFDPKLEDNVLPVVGRDSVVEYAGTIPASNWVEQLRATNGPPLINLIPPQARISNWNARVQTLRIQLQLRLPLDKTDDNFTHFSTRISIESLREQLTRCHSERCTRRTGLKHQMAIQSISLLQPSLRHTICPSMPWTLSLKSPEYLVPFYTPEGPPAKVIDKEWFIDYPVYARHDAVSGKIYPAKGLTLSSADETLGRAPSVVAYAAHGLNLRALEYWNLLLHDHPRFMTRLIDDKNVVYTEQAPMDRDTPCPNMLTYALTRRGRKTIGTNFSSHTIGTARYHAWPEAKFREHLQSIASDLFERPFVQSETHRLHPLLGTVDNSFLTLTATPAELKPWLQQVAERRETLKNGANRVRSFELDAVLQIVAVIV